MDSQRGSKGIKSWPKSERPREILLEKGPEFVSDAGLVAILLRTGLKGKDAVTLSRELLHHFGGLKGILNANKKELEKVKGLGTAKISQLLAAIEIAKRQLKEGIVGNKPIKGPEDVIEYVSLSMANLKEEIFKVIYLNSANIILAMEDLFKGTVNQSAVYPREVVKRALELNACALIFVHNHPSGNTQASEDDVKLTKRLVEAGQIVGIPVLDHIIIGDKNFLSLKREGLF